MNKQINVNFSPKGVQEAIELLNTIYSDLQKIPDKLAEEIAKDGAEYLQQQYDNRDYGVFMKNERLEQPTIQVNKITNGWEIRASGKDILYDEFGTGEQGKASGYDKEERAKYNLNDYNSGPVVSTHINKYGRHYWFYNGHYTEGIPAGKQFFNTRNYIIDEGARKVARRLVGEILSKH